MLVNSKEMLIDARKKESVIYHFNINNLEWAKIILEKCNEMRTPVILGASLGAIKYMGGFSVVSNMVKSLINDLNIIIPVALHLDHGDSFESCKKAIDAGFTSVMIDASKLDFENNVKETKRVVAYAHERDVTVEAEIGHVGGIEDNVASDVLVADYEDCLKFIHETGIDSLAPAIGTVHGIYKGEVNIQYDLIKKLHDNTDIPLVMHGGSGLDHDVLRKAIKCGINKINVNSDIQYVWVQAVKEYIANNPSVYDPRKVIYSGAEAMNKFIEDKINIFDNTK